MDQITELIAEGASHVDAPLLSRGLPEDRQRVLVEPVVVPVTVQVRLGTVVPDVRHVRPLVVTGHVPVTSFPSRTPSADASTL